MLPSALHGRPRSRPGLQHFILQYRDPKPTALVEPSAACLPPKPYVCLQDGNTASSADRSMETELIGVGDLSLCCLYVAWVQEKTL